MPVAVAGSSYGLFRVLGGGGRRVGWVLSVRVRRAAVREAAARDDAVEKASTGDELSG